MHMDTHARDDAMLATLGMCQHQAAWTECDIAVSAIRWPCMAKHGYEVVATLRIMSRARQKLQECDKSHTPKSVYHLCMGVVCLCACVQALGDLTSQERCDAREC